MSWSRGAKRVSLVVALALVALLVFALSSQAQVEGPCTGTINGQDFRGRVVVPENNTVAWEFNSNAGPIESWAVTLFFAGIPIPVDSGVDEDPDQSTKGGVADVNSYAKYSVGIYHLTGTVAAESDTCSGSVEIVVKGNPLATVAGLSAAGAAAAGIGGGAAAASAAAKSALAGLKP